MIFVDADQIVRADMKELYTMDLQGKPYGYTPFCDNNKEMDGYRFWKQVRACFFFLVAYVFLSETHKHTREAIQNLLPTLRVFGKTIFTIDPTTSARSMSSILKPFDEKRPEIF